MKLIFALGNPESHYDGSRHNVGFAVVDTWVQQHDGLFKEKNKLKARIAELQVDGEKVIVAKPTTYYNLVGVSFRAISDFYKIEPSDTLIIADELALPFGTVRVREGGSDAGSNGIKSIIEHGGEHTKRLRIGVANDHTQFDQVGFVLSKFTKEESEALDALQPKLSDIITRFVHGSLEVTTHKHL